MTGPGIKHEGCGCPKFEATQPRMRKRPAGRFVNALITGMKRRLLPILLNARGAQSGEAVLFDRELPGQEFFGRQRVTLAGLFK